VCTWNNSHNGRGKSGIQVGRGGGSKEKKEEDEKTKEEEEKEEKKKKKKKKKKKTVFIGKLHWSLRKKLMKCYFSSMDLCGNVNWTLVDQNYVTLEKGGEDQLD